MRIILTSILTSGLIVAFIACGTDPAKTPTTTAVTYASVQATLMGSCGQANCHGAGTTSISLMTQANYEAKAVDIQDRISSTPNGTAMPENGDWGTASAAQITAAKSYLNGL